MFKLLSLMALVLTVLLAGCPAPLLEAHAPTYPMNPPLTLPKIAVPDVQVPAEIQILPGIPHPVPDLREDAIPWEEGHAEERHGLQGWEARKAHQDPKRPCSMAVCRDTPSGMSKYLRSCYAADGTTAVQWLNVTYDTGEVLVREGTAFVVTNKVLARLIKNNECSHIFGNYLEGFGLTN